eukprot:GHVR01031160.1.p1 GENE.GHVR01031160.1~~GHVR01031160.1.p1  ORF type:complete len:435 (+),score=100.70 GHVR01031160.1:26-1330(+)
MPPKGAVKGTVAVKLFPELEEEIESEIEVPDPSVTVVTVVITSRPVTPPPDTTTTESSEPDKFDVSAKLTEWFRENITKQEGTSPLADTPFASTKVITICKEDLGPTAVEKGLKDPKDSSELSIDATYKLMAMIQSEWIKAIRISKKNATKEKAKLGKTDEEVKPSNEPRKSVAKGKQPIQENIFVPEIVSLDVILLLADIIPQDIDDTDQNNNNNSIDFHWKSMSDAGVTLTAGVWLDAHTPTTQTDSIMNKRPSNNIGNEIQIERINSKSGDNIDNQEDEQKVGQISEKKQLPPESMKSLNEFTQIAPTDSTLADTIVIILSSLFEKYGTYINTDTQTTENTTQQKQSVIDTNPPSGQFQFDFLLLALDFMAALQGVETDRRMFEEYKSNANVTTIPIYTPKVISTKADEINESVEPNETQEKSPMNYDDRS